MYLEKYARPPCALTLVSCEIGDALYELANDVHLLASLAWHDELDERLGF